MDPQVVSVAHRQMIVLQLHSPASSLQLCPGISNNIICVISARQMAECAAMFFSGYYSCTTAMFCTTTGPTPSQSHTAEHEQQINIKHGQCPLSLFSPSAHRHLTLANETRIYLCSFYSLSIWPFLLFTSDARFCLISRPLNLLLIRGGCT